MTTNDLLSFYQPRGAAACMCSVGGRNGVPKPYEWPNPSCCTMHHKLHVAALEAQDESVCLYPVMDGFYAVAEAGGSLGVNAVESSWPNVTAHRT
jgi:hypothetical protein